MKYCTAGRVKRILSLPAQEATLANVYREVVATVRFEKIMMYFHRHTIYSFGLSFVCCRALWT